MKKHSGIRPHDIVILLKISLLAPEQYMAKELASDLGISGSEISESLNRSSIAGFLSNDKKMLLRRQLMEFLQYGIKYTFPQRPGAIVRGMATAHSAPPLNRLINSAEHFVWPDGEGNMLGQMIEPLHPKAPQACKKDFKLYELLALTDAIRAGNVREQNLAVEELKKRIFKNEQQ